MGSNVIRSTPPVTPNLQGHMYLRRMIRIPKHPAVIGWMIKTSYGVMI